MPMNSRRNPICKRSELKYLSNFRKKNQMRFYYQQKTDKEEPFK